MGFNSGFKGLTFRTAAGDGSLDRSALQETLSLGVLCQVGSMKAEMMMMMMMIMMIIIITKEAEEMLKYKDLTIEIQRM